MNFFTKIYLIVTKNFYIIILVISCLSTLLLGVSNNLCYRSIKKLAQDLPEFFVYSDFFLCNKNEYPSLPGKAYID